MQDAYAAMWFAARPMVLGRRMLPFAVGHAAILGALGSPYIDGGNARLSDLVVGAWVCSRQASGIGDAVHGDMDALARECARWGRRHRGLTADRQAREMATFAAYIGQHTQAPRRWEKPGQSGGGVRVPWQLAMWHKLARGDWSPGALARAWDTPMAVATALLSCESAAAGDDGLMSDAELDAIERLRANGK